MLCDRSSHTSDARSPPVATSAVEVASPNLRICTGQDRDYSDHIPMSTMTSQSSSPPATENHSSSSPILHGSVNKPKLSFSISRLLGDDSREQDSDNRDNNISRSSTDNSCGSARTTPASPVMVSCPSIITSQSYYSPTVSSVPVVVSSHYDPLQSGANGTVIRVPAHRPAPLSYPTAVSFPWAGSQGQFKDRIPGKCIFKCIINTFNAKNFKCGAWLKHGQIGRALEPLIYGPLKFGMHCFKDDILILF